MTIHQPQIDDAGRRHGQPSGSSEPPLADRRPTIWLEVEDLLRVVYEGERPNGIPRVCLELIHAAQRSPDLGVRFCRLSYHTQHFEVLPSDTPMAEWAIARVGRFVGARYLRYRLRQLRDLLGRSKQEQAFAREVAAGDIVLSVGSIWPYDHYPQSIADTKRRYAVSFAVLIHDIIPALQPAFFAPYVGPSFLRSLLDTLQAADALVVASRDCRDSIVGFCRERGLTAPPVEVVAFGAGFTDPDAALPHRAAKFPDRFVLYVSTIEIRKNHKLLLAVWRRLLAKHGAERVPALLLIGKAGWLVEDLMQDLGATGNLGGKIIIMSGLPDADVAQAYRQCIFTVYPSLWEGWGLPVAESLLHGKLCISSNRASLPEVGGDLVDYFDPDNEDEAFAGIERAIFDSDYLRERTLRIVSDYRPPSWDDCIAEIAGRLRATAMTDGGKREAAT